MTLASRDLATKCTAHSQQHRWTRTCRRALALLAAWASLANPLAHATTPHVSELRPIEGSASSRIDCPAGGLAMTVPWAVGGPRIEPDGSTRWFGGDWPDLPLTGIRLWDTRTAWLNLEPADDQWHFERLDAFLAKAQANGVEDITLVLAGTPQWAASTATPGEAHWLGPGSASPPKDIQQWRQFVRMVATRYASRITAYELWNEPNSRTFFTGTPKQWASMVAIASREIRMADPGARIQASGFTMNTPADLERVRPWLAALGKEGAQLDALTLHWYPASWAQLRSLARTAERFRRLAGSLGLTTTLAVTEANAKVRSTFPGSREREVVDTLIEQSWRAGIDGLTWYAWLDLPTALMPLHRGTAASAALGASCLKGASGRSRGR